MELPLIMLHGRSLGIAPSTSMSTWIFEVQDVYLLEVGRIG